MYSTTHQYQYFELTDLCTASTRITLPTTPKKAATGSTSILEASHNSTPGRYANTKTTYPDTVEYVYSQIKHDLNHSMSWGIDANLFLRMALKLTNDDEYKPIIKSWTLPSDGTGKPAPRLFSKPWFESKKPAVPPALDFRFPYNIVRPRYPPSCPPFHPSWWYRSSSYIPLCPYSYLCSWVSPLSNYRWTPILLVLV